ncbi:MAG: hypothetical protein JSR59_19580 [Proteobacteria bacterium]|nr:hypothetical protein [Pseudomonadota bacterium]
MTSPSTRTRTMTRRTPLLLGAATLTLAATAMPAAADQVTQNQLKGAAYMASICGGLSQGSGLSPGNAIAMAPTGYDCESATGGTMGGQAAQSVNYAWTGGGLPQSATAQGSAGFGVIHLSSSYSGSNNAGFDLAAASGGWQDVMTINAVNPADNGQAAMLHFGISVSGTLDAATTGGNTFAQILLQPWFNQYLRPAGWSDGFQAIGNQTQHQDVGTVATLSFGFTLGQPFTLGIFAMSADGNASVSGANVINHASSDFSHTLLWNGIDSVTVNGQSIDYSITSASGMDWRNAVSAVPEPGGVALWACGLLALGVTRAARRGAGRTT